MSFPPGCGSGGPCDWATYCAANPGRCNASGTGLRPQSVLSVYNPGTAVSTDTPSWSTLKAQLDALDAQGSRTTPNPTVCAQRPEQLVYSWGCARIGELAPIAVYESARRGIDGLMRVLPPNDGPGRQAYYNAVMGYAAVMSRASNVLGSDMAAEYGTPSLPGTLHRDPPYYYGPSDSQFWALNTAGSSRLPEAPFNSTTGGVHHVEFISSGLAYVTRAREIATRLAPVTFLQYQAKKLTEYAAYVATWPASWGSSSAEVIAKAGSAKAASNAGDVRTGIGIAAAAINVIPVIGQIGSGVLAALTALLSFLPTAVGAVQCPVPYSYRVLTDSSCQPSTPAPPPPPGWSAGVSATTKSAIPTAALVVGGAIALGIIVFWPKK